MCFGKGSKSAPAAQPAPTPPPVPTAPNIVTESEAAANFPTAVSEGNVETTAITTSGNTGLNIPT